MSEIKTAAQQQQRPWEQLLEKIKTKKVEEKKEGQRQGRLCLITGPMFAGKTTELRRQIQNNYYADIATLVCKHGNDETRNGQELKTHDNQTIRMPCISITCLADVTQLLKQKPDVTHIFIDEAQFLKETKESVTAFVRTYVDEGGKTLVMAMLDMTSSQEPFASGVLETLLSLKPDQHLRLSGICMACKSPNGLYSYRKDVADTNECRIGGVETYACVCSECLAALLLLGAPAPAALATPAARR